MHTRIFLEIDDSESQGVSGGGSEVTPMAVVTRTSQMTSRLTSCMLSPSSLPSSRLGGERRDRGGKIELVTVDVGRRVGRRKRGMSVKVRV